MRSFVVVGDGLKSLLVQKLNQILCSPDKLEKNEARRAANENEPLEPFLVEEVKWRPLKLK